MDGQVRAKPDFYGSLASTPVKTTNTTQFEENQDDETSNARVVSGVSHKHFRATTQMPSAPTEATAGGAAVTEPE